MPGHPIATILRVTKRLAPVISLLAAVISAPAAAADLGRFLDRPAVGHLVPGANRIGPAEGAPPAATAFRDGKTIGYVFLTSDWVASSGYSGKPIRILVGLGLDGVITGAEIAEHSEPILVLGIPEKRLGEFLAQYKGLNVARRVHLDRASAGKDHRIDLIGGATITSVVFNDSVLRAARMVARAKGVLVEEAAGRGLDLDRYTPASWTELLAQNALGALHVSNAGLAQMTGTPVPEGRRPEDAFIDVFAGIATPAGIGQNLLGFAAYTQLRRQLKEGDQVLFVGGKGLYSIRGYAYRRSGTFDRIQLIQGERTIALTAAMHRPVEKLNAAGAPELREASLFVLPAASGFSPVKPWRLEVLVEPTADGRSAVLALGHQIPAGYVISGAQDGDAVPSWVHDILESAEMMPDGEVPLWVRRWLDNTVELAILCLALAVLTVVWFLQDWFVQHTAWVSRLRVIFLTFTLVFIGWTTAAQLSVINVLTFINAMLSGFHWDFFLLEPLIFVLWGGVAVGLLFWGRGVFCGWLCPFGALQELVNRAAQYVKVPQFDIPFYVHERLWPFKYMIFLGLFALSLGSATLAAQFAEIEPFKTAIALKFVRAWPFVLYAVVLLAAGMVVPRVFCRYLCPLGAALAIPANNRMFDWLKRRPACGRECHICATRCQVQAIHPNGTINPHECIYCLDCQAIYHDDHRCPPLIERRKRREERRRQREERKAARAAAPTPVGDPS